MTAPKLAFLPWWNQHKHLYGSNPSDRKPLIGFIEVKQRFRQVIFDLGGDEQAYQSLMTAMYSDLFSCSEVELFRATQTRLGQLEELPQVVQKGLMIAMLEATIFLKEPDLEECEPQ